MTSASLNLHATLCFCDTYLRHNDEKNPTFFVCIFAVLVGLNRKVYARLSIIQGSLITHVKKRTSWAKENCCIRISYYHCVEILNN